MIINIPVTTRSKGGYMTILTKTCLQTLSGYLSSCRIHAEAFYQDEDCFRQLTDPQRQTLQACLDRLVRTMHVLSSTFKIRCKSIPAASENPLPPLEKGENNVNS